LVGLLAGLTDCLAGRQAKTQIAAKRGAGYAAERAANVVRGVEPGRQLRRYGVLACTRASIIGDAATLIVLRSAEQKSRSPVV